MNIVRMDGFLSSIMAADSIIGCRAVMHGPGGCRTHTSRLSATRMLRDYEVREGPFYFNHPRVPCTYVDDEDYVNGADYKVTELLDTVNDAEVCVVIASPGTSLIGDDLNGAAYRSSFKGITVIPEYCHMSEPAHAGYDSTIADIVKSVCKKKPTRKGTANILGLPIILEGWETTVSEFKGYLEAMGIEVLACVGAGCTVDELKESSAAEFNVSIFKEYCAETVSEYEQFGIKTIFSETPIGFASTKSWIHNAAQFFGVDPTPALEILHAAEIRASRVLKARLTEGFVARCATFSVQVDSSLVLPLTKWLYGYLSMFPECIAVCDWWDAEYRKELDEFLASVHCSGATSKPIESSRCDVLLSDGLTAKIFEKKGICSIGIDVWLPSKHRMNFVDRPILGAKGAMRILDDIFYDIQRN